MRMRNVPFGSFRPGCRRQAGALKFLPHTPAPDRSELIGSGSDCAKVLKKLRDVMDAVRALFLRLLSAASPNGLVVGAICVNLWGIERWYLTCAACSQRVGCLVIIAG